MTILILISTIVAYLGIGAWTFGYVKGATADKENGWETPMPLVAGIFWPLVVGIISLSYVMMPAQRMGFAFQQAKLKKKRKRIAEQEKVRIQIQEADKEIAQAEKDLEEEFRALEKEQQSYREKRR